MLCQVARSSWSRQLLMINRHTRMCSKWREGLSSSGTNRQNVRADFVGVASNTYFKIISMKTIEFPDATPGGNGRECSSEISKMTPKDTKRERDSIRFLPLKDSRVRGTPTYTGILRPRSEPFIFSHTKQLWKIKTLSYIKFWKIGILSYTESSPLLHA